MCFTFDCELMQPGQNKNKFNFIICIIKRRKCIGVPEEAEYFLVPCYKSNSMSHYREGMEKDILQSISCFFLLLGCVYFAHFEEAEFFLVPAVMTMHMLIDT